MRNRIIIKNNAPIPGSVRSTIGSGKLKEQRAVVSEPTLKIRGAREWLCLAVAAWTLALLLSDATALASTLKLPQTGQTKCYETASPYGEISCADTGQDGDKMVGVEWAADIRFTAGTGAEVNCVTDNLTGLMWVKNPDSTKRTWQAAIDYAKSLNLCGFEDWRLPSLIELESMVNTELSDSSVWLNTQGFSNVKSGYYWASTTYAGYTSYAWYVDMHYGKVASYAKSNSTNVYVWLVRGGQAAEPSDIWKSGQTKCYDTSGTEIDCEGTDQDGDLKPGVAWPAPRFSNNGNGTVTDNLTGLIWLRNANCFGSRTWGQALSDSNSLASSSCGLSDGSAAGDWRLPNRKELLSLADFEYFTLTLSNADGTAKWSSGDPFVNVQSSTSYWSSTTYAPVPEGAWDVSMNDGNVGSYIKTYTRSVWPVRGGQYWSLVDLTISKIGSGTVTVDKGTINWSENTGSASYIQGMMVTLTAQAETGSTFSGWSGDCSGTDSPLSVLVDAPKTCTATFTLNTHDLTVDKTGTGSGTVGGGGTYYYDTTHEITAVAETGSTFSGWSGDCSGTDSPLSVTILDRNMTCTATFTLNQYTLTVNIDPASTGSGTVGGGGTYYYGTTHEITAVAATGSTFSGWNGDCSGTDSPLSVLVDASKTCTATFAISNVLRDSFGGGKTWYIWIQDAFDEAEDGDTILIRDLSFSEDLYFSQGGISVLIQGGCDTDFIPMTGHYSTVQSFEINTGTVEIENLILQ